MRRRAGCACERAGGEQTANSKEQAATNRQQAETAENRPQRANSEQRAVLTTTNDESLTAEVDEVVALRIEEVRTRTRRITRRRALGVRPLRIVTDVLPRVRKDTLPDRVDYRDEGRDLFASCLRCPLAQCQYDVPEQQRRRFRLDARDREIALLRERHHAPIDALAETYGLTRRTVFHILAQQREAAPAVAAGGDDDRSSRRARA